MSLALTGRGVGGRQTVPLPDNGTAMATKASRANRARLCQYTDILTDDAIDWLEEFMGRVKPKYRENLVEFLDEIQANEHRGLHSSGSSRFGDIVTGQIRDEALDNFGAQTAASPRNGGTPSGKRSNGSGGSHNGIDDDVPLPYSIGDEMATSRRAGTQNMSTFRPWITNPAWRKKQNEMVKEYVKNCNRGTSLYSAEDEATWRRRLTSGYNESFRGGRPLTSESDRQMNSFAAFQNENSNKGQLVRHYAAKYLKPEALGRVRHWVEEGSEQDRLDLIKVFRRLESFRQSTTYRGTMAYRRARPSTPAFHARQWATQPDEAPANSQTGGGGDQSSLLEARRKLLEQQRELEQKKAALAASQRAGPVVTKGNRVANASTAVLQGGTSTNTDEPALATVSDLAEIRRQAQFGAHKATYKSPWATLATGEMNKQWGQSRYRSNFVNPTKVEMPVPAQKLHGLNSAVGNRLLPDYSHRQKIQLS